MKNTLGTLLTAVAISAVTPGCKDGMESVQCEGLKGDFDRAAEDAIPDTSLFRDNRCERRDFLYGDVDLKARIFQEQCDLSDGIVNGLREQLDRVANLQRKKCPPIEPIKGKIH